MFRILLSTLLVSVTTVAPPSVSIFRPLPDLIKHTEMSMVKVIEPHVEEDTSYTCTGFVVNSARGWILTAEHCVNANTDGIFIDGTEIEAKVIRTSDSLALLQIQPMYKPPLEFREHQAPLGEEVVALGYGKRIMTALSRHVAMLLGPDYSFDGNFVPGMSGGPIVDMAGKVVGMVQAGDDFLGYGCGEKEMRDFLKSVK